MTPKEKAEQLVNNFYEPFYYNDSLSSKRILYTRAKQCALIAVDEMMEVYASALVALGHSTEEAEAVESPYLKEVKKEIEKL